MKAETEERHKAVEKKIIEDLDKKRKQEEMVEETRTKIMQLRVKLGFEDNQNQVVDVVMEEYLDKKNRHENQVKEQKEKKAAGLVYNNNAISKQEVMDSLIQEKEKFKAI